MKRILMLGGSGLVGNAIINELKKDKNNLLSATYLNRPINRSEVNAYQLNVDDPDTITGLCDTVKPDLIISCLRGDFAKQRMVHEKAADYLKGNGGRLYFFSTTNVFDKDFSRPHYEDDIPDSQTDYGNYKIECESRLTEILKENAVILRIPQVWGKKSPRMMQLLDMLTQNKEIIVYPKFYHNTNTDVMIAKQLQYIIHNDLKGNFHLVSDDYVNYKDFYSELITKLGFKNAKITDSLEEEGFFAILSKRLKEFPDNLRITNQAVIQYLTSDLKDD